MIKKRIPQHVAIIMDGNGRWAKQRGLMRAQGHLEGVKRVSELLDAAQEYGVKILTLFAFSTENWTRPKGEVNQLMKVFVDVLKKQLTRFQKQNIRFVFCGSRKGVPLKVLKELDHMIAETAMNTKLIVNVAFNYGSRMEIVEAARQFARDVIGRSMDPERLTVEKFCQYLYTRELPDPDLMIRTSGEQRISNFLLWQLSYSELYFTDVLWPDFTPDEFKKALDDFAKRERRFGDVKPRKQ